MQSRRARTRANAWVSVKAAVVVLGLAGAIVVFGVLGAAARDAERMDTGSQASAPLGLTEAQAIEIAHTVAPQVADREVKAAEAGPLSQVWEDSAALDWAQSVPRDQLVWYLYFRDPNDGRGTIVVLDFVNGTEYEVMDLR
jgi:hypothetical protein